MMFWYILLFLFLILFVIEHFGSVNKYSINILTVFIILLLSVVSGLRGDFGADTVGYIDYFEHIPPLSEYFSILDDGGRVNPTNHLEPLYVFIVSSFKLFSNNYNLFQFVQSFSLLALVTLSLKRLNAPVNIGLIIYFFL